MTQVPDQSVRQQAHSLLLAVVRLLAPDPRFYAPYSLSAWLRQQAPLGVWREESKAAVAVWEEVSWVYAGRVRRVYARGEEDGCRPLATPTARHLCCASQRGLEQASSIISIISISPLYDLYDLYETLGPYERRIL